MHFKAFKDEGIEPELENKMEQLFGVLVDQRVHNKPSSVVDCSQHVECEKDTVPVPSPPPSLNVGDASYECDDEISENNAFDPNQANTEQQEQLRNDHHSPIPSPVPLRCCGHGFENDASESQKSCKTELVVTERNVRVMELMNNEARKLVDSSHTLVESIAKLVSIPGLIHGSPEFCFACTLIEDPQKRTILHGIPDDYSRLQWIKFLYGEHRKI